MSEQGWLKREMEVVQCEVATWPTWKRGEGMKDAKRYKLCQDVCYDDGAFVIPAGQVMVREADYDALRDERDRLAKALKALVSEVGSYTVERQYYSREEASKDLDRREKALLAQLQQAKAALTPAGGQQGEGK